VRRTARHGGAGTGLDIAGLALPGAGRVAAKAVDASQPRKALTGRGTAAALGHARDAAAARAVVGRGAVRAAAARSLAGGRAADVGSTGVLHQRGALLATAARTGGAHGLHPVLAGRGLALGRARFDAVRRAAGRRAAAHLVAIAFVGRGAANAGEQPARAARTALAIVRIAAATGAVTAHPVGAEAALALVREGTAAAVGFRRQTIGRVAVVAGRALAVLDAGVFASDTRAGVRSAILSLLRRAARRASVAHGR